MLLHFASIPVPRAILEVGVAFRALCLEPLSTQLAPQLLLHVVSFSFHAGSKSNVRGNRCLLGSLFGTFLGRWSVNSAFIFKLRLLWLLSESPRLGNSPQLKLTKPLKDSTANGLRGWSGGMRGAIEFRPPEGATGRVEQLCS